MWKRIGIVVAVLFLIGLICGGALVWNIWKHPLALYEKSGKRTLEGAGFIRSNIDTTAGDLVYWYAGSGPALIFLHGAGDTAGAWSRVAPEFVADYTVYVPDLPGHGASEPGEGTLPISVIYDGVASLVETASGEGPSTLVGNSLGGWLAMLCAINDPIAVRHVVSVNGGGITNDPGDLTLTPTNRQQARQLIQAIRDPSSPHVPDFVLDDIVRRASDGPIMRMTMEMEDLVAHLLDERLEEMTTPVDLVWGMSDQLLSYDYALKLKAGLPASRLSKLEACGHVPQNECPAQLTGKLRGVLASELPRSRDEQP